MALSLTFPPPLFVWCPAWPACNCRTLYQLWIWPACTQSAHHSHLCTTQTNLDILKFASVADQVSSELFADAVIIFSHMDRVTSWFFCSGNMISIFYFRILLWTWKIHVLSMSITAPARSGLIRIDQIRHNTVQNRLSCSFTSAHIKCFKFKNHSWCRRPWKKSMWN